MDDLFLHKLNILAKLDVFSLLDSTEHFLFFFHLGKTLGNPSGPWMDSVKTL